MPTIELPTADGAMRVVDLQRMSYTELEALVDLALASAANPIDALTGRRRAFRTALLSTVAAIPHLRNELDQVAAMLPEILGADDTPAARGRRPATLETAPNAGHEANLISEARLLACLRMVGLWKTSPDGLIGEFRADDIRGVLNLLGQERETSAKLRTALDVDPCPKGDPDCETGDDGSCHDGCRAPNEVAWPVASWRQVPMLAGVVTHVLVLQQTEGAACAVYGRGSYQAAEMDLFLFSSGLHRGAVQSIDDAPPDWFVPSPELLAHLAASEASHV